MTTAQHIADAKRKKIFASVFPDSSVRPPTQHQRFEPKAQTYTSDLNRILLESSRFILGIGDEGFEYGRDPGHGFKTHFASCPDMDTVKEPTDEDISAQCDKYAGMRIWKYVREWQHQIGANQVRKALAAVLNQIITEFIQWSYAGVYEQDVIRHLKFWIKYLFAAYVIQFLDFLQKAEPRTSRERTLHLTTTDGQRWLEMAISRLGALRVDELFDIVVDWDATQAGIDDLKHYTTNPTTRTYLTNNFNMALATRLLHPGASTTEILHLYISIIRAFRKLDPKGVLLDRVARVIRRYLRDRDDAVRVIVAGLLSDPPTVESDVMPPDQDTLNELALELTQHDPDNRHDDEELDWDNMNWLPNPVDAAPDYMRSKNTDVIGSLISMFETKEAFVRELQTALAERLLRNKSEYDQEISVLEHLKIRFGDAALQGCEVMLRDVLDSRKVNKAIREDPVMQGDLRSGQQPQVDLHAKILSRLFWPPLQDFEYNVPKPVLDEQARYEKGFEGLKQSRKLTWLNGLGQVEVELDLEDRVFCDEVLPWQAAAIYAFQDTVPDTRRSRPVSKTVEELAAALEMSPALARSACVFWVSRNILAESAKDTFTVLETLPGGGNLARADSLGQPDAVVTAAAAAEEAAAQAMREAEEAERKQKMAMYTQFILSMLTNQGAMPLPRIAMMLGLVVPGGFPFSNEELKEFLTMMVRDGKLEVGPGGIYKVVI